MFSTKSEQESLKIRGDINLVNIGGPAQIIYQRWGRFGSDAKGAALLTPYEDFDLLSAK